jgi:ELWxxDGT repeat protein
MERGVLRILLKTFILLCIGITLNAQPALVTEVPKASKNYINIGNLVFFTSGDSLWRTDGTAEGTIFLKSGFGSFSAYTPFTEWNGMLFFPSASSSQPSRVEWKELWASDGTPAGTVLLKESSTYDIYITGQTGSYLFFVASESATGRELYRTNGTPSGTMLVKDINPGPANGVGGLGETIGNSFLFSANDGTHGTELWKTDGSASGTTMVEDINPGSGAGFASGSVFSYNNLFYFKGFTSATGEEPWVSDGSAAGTTILKDIVPGAGSVGFAEYKIGHDGVLYFIAKPPYAQWRDEGSVADLWKTGGTMATTEKVETLSDAVTTFDNAFRVYDGKVFFFGRWDGGPDVLYQTDGTPSGTGPVTSVGNYEGRILFFHVVNDYMLFYGSADGHPTPFFRSDGTSSGTQEFTRFNSGAYVMYPRDVTKVGDMVFYGDHDGPSDNGYPENEEDYYQLIQSDGITTQSVRKIFGGTYAGTNDIVDFNGIVLFTTENDQYNSADTQKRLWIYDASNPPTPAGVFTLVNADTDEDIQRITDNETIQLPEGVNFSVRYDPVGTPGSVRFTSGGGILRTENEAPYALNGDVNGNYYPWTGPEDLSIDASEFSEPQAKGTLGHQESITFQIIRGSGSEDCTASGTILREQWNNVSGNNVSAIPVHSPPSNTSQLNIFEGPTNSQTNFGARMRGYICPPKTGNYTFWIASNDHSELWLSTDDSPSNKVKIAYVTGATTPRQWTKFPSQTSAAINLTAGKRYYIEALHKQGAGSHNIAVGWQLPDGTLERPIPGSRLSPFSDQGNQSPVVEIFGPADGQSFDAPATITIEANASDPDGSISKVEFFEGSNKLGEDLTFPYNYRWSDVGIGTYSFTAKAFDNDGAVTISAPVAATVNEETGGCTAYGMISWEYWGGVAGARVSDIPVNSAPTRTGELSSFEGPTNHGTNYGSRIRGYICAPETGNYTFWIASNDHSELWLSTDDNPANKRRIAYVLGATNEYEFNKFSSQKSVTMALVQGKTYYVEALHKQGVGSDHVSVAWQRPAGGMKYPLDGQYLSPYESQSSASARAATSLSSEQEAQYKEINIYPNPVQSGDPELTISGYERVEVPVETDIEIMNMTGDVVFAERIQCGGNCSTYLMNVNKHLVPGVYLVNMNTNGIRSWKRLLVK